jgi:Fe-S cluster assembly protein SufD
VATVLAKAAPLPLDRETVERFAIERDEPDWLRHARLESTDGFTPEAWPTGQEEEWRRFPLKDIPTGPLVGGVAATSYRGELPRGAALGDLAEAARAQADLLRSWLATSSAASSGHLTGGTHAAFRALAGALWSAGSLVFLPDRAEAREPLWIERRWHAGNEAALSRTVVVAGEGSRATIVEEITSEPGAPRLAVPRLDLHLGSGAQVRYVRIQRFAEDVWDLGSQRYTSERDSRLASFNVLVGSGRTKVGVESDIVGDGAEVKLYGLVAAADEQRIDVNSLQIVDGKGSTSDLLYLSALYASAKAVYYGKIRVEPTSSGTGSYQECRNVLLSDKAGASPIPVLEILTNDVARCGHGATAGALEETELFYVMSRGFDRRDAEQLLVRGFFQRVIDGIPEEEVRARVLAALVPRIGRIAELEVAA